MRFAIVAREDSRSTELATSIRSRMVQAGLVFDEVRPELVVTVGGDGTLLHAFAQYQGLLADVAFVGVHTGHLGFYADWNVSELDLLIEKIVQEPLTVVAYPLLEMAVSFLDGRPTVRKLALNEVTIRGEGNTLVIDVAMQGEHFERFRGDGLCFSTPSGSTAYNKSLGGGIIHPSLEAIQMAEMASINNRVYRTIGSAMIFPKHHAVVLIPVEQEGFHFTIDHLSCFETGVAEVVFRVSEEKIRFARYRPFPFWKRVSEAFIDGRD